MPATFGLLFLILMVVGVPIAIALSLAPIVGFMLAEKWAFLNIVPQKLIGGINQFPLLAIPLFILAGEVMNAGGVTSRLVAVAQVFVGHFRAGLAQVNIATSMLFAGLSGSAVADTSALGSMLIPAMEKQGYSRRFAAAVTAASSIIGPIIPPSIMMVIYAFVMQVSVGGLFLAGLVPGIIMGILLMAMTRLLANRKQLPPESARATTVMKLHAVRDGILPMMSPAIVLIGIVGGVFTPTEAAAVVLVNTIFISLFVLKTLSIRDLPAILSRGVSQSVSILYIIAAGALFAWAIALSGAPQQLAATALSAFESPVFVLLALNVFLLIVGMVLDAGPAVLIVGPLVAPTMLQFGVDPLHLAAVICINLSVGLATPPMGLVLFVAESISGENFFAICRERLPYYAVHIFVIGADDLRAGNLDDIAATVRIRGLGCQLITQGDPCR